MLTYPEFNPVAFQVGPVAVHWYGLMFLVAFASSWWFGRMRASRPGSTWKPTDVDDFMFYGMVGVILGGRIGYLFFYGLEFWARDAWYPFKIWQGGMSFHGGLLGTLIAFAVFARVRKRAIADVFDFAAPLPGLGIAAVRCANFINGELWGHPTDVPWGFDVNGVVLHATQLYEALLEGVVLGIVLWTFTRKPRPRLAPTGLFLVMYGVARITVEYWRVPDEQIGYFVGDWLTMGMLLTFPMVVAGGVLLVLAYRRKQASANYAPAA
jgi:phosphatidylglycerol---prolipoprotein diacylglyceryl transferase